MPENKIQITIEALNKFQEVFSQFKKQVEDSQEKVKSSSSAIGKSFDFIKSKWLEIIAVYGSIRGLIALTELGTKVEQVKDSFHTVTQSMKIDGDALIAAMKQVSYVFVDETDLMIRAQRALVQGLSPKQIIELTEAARVAARYMGVDVSQAFEQILDAVMTLRTRGLKAAFTVDVESAVASYARKLGVTKEEVSEFGKMQAIANAIIDESKRKLDILGGVLVPTTAEKFQKTKSAVQELKETLGTGLLGTISIVGGAFYGLGASILSFVAAGYKLYGLFQAIKGNKEAGETYRIAGGDLAKEMIDMAEKGNEMLRLGLKKFAEGTQEVGTKAIGTTKTGILGPSLLDPEAVRKANDERLKMQREYQIKELQLGTETLDKKLKIFDLEEQQAKKEAEKIGASTLAITNYYAAARLEAIKEWDIKIAEAMALKGYEPPEEKWVIDSLNFLNEYQKGLLNLDKEYFNLRGNINDLIAIDKQLEDLEIKGLHDRGILTDELLIKTQRLGEERRNQMRIAAEVGSFKYPPYEVPGIEWETAGRAVALERDKFFIDIRKGYASIMADTRALIALDKEEEENYIAGLKNKMGLTEKEEELIRKTGEQRRYQMTIEYQFYQNISQVWGSHLASMLKGAESLKDGLKGIFKDMSDYFISMVSKMAMNWLFFENIQGGGKFLGGGSGLGSIVGWIGSLLKFGEGGVTLGWKPMKAFQEGGVAYGPTLGMIGEGGPEAFVPLKGGRIPVEMAGGGNTIIVHNYITNIKAMDTISARDFVQRNPGPFIEVISSDLGDKGSTYQALTRRRQ